jgi:hypothetical protein
MKQEYSDITEKLGKPLWWDEAGCPRYAPFQPCMANDFYAKEVALIRVKCQSCEEEFLVCVSSGEQNKKPLSQRKTLFYGDPPRGCCGVGATMTSEFVAVVESWALGKNDWERTKLNPQKYPWINA